MLTIKTGLLPPLRLVIAPRNFLTVGGCVSGSLLTIRPRFTVLNGGGGWVCAKMARELKWNSQNLPPTRHPLIKTSVLLSLATSLHVSTVVKLRVIRPDSFIMLKSTIFHAAFFGHSAKRCLFLDKCICSPLCSGNQLETSFALLCQCRSSFLRSINCSTVSTVPFHQRIQLNSLLME